MVTPIEDYAVLGDTETAALVSRTGSIDWLCLPHFDSHACFAALLGTPENGRWLIGPVAPARTTRRYLDHSFVLETIHETADGAVRVTDLMPLGDGRADLLRRVQGVRGTVRMRHEWVVRFNYGRIRPWVSRAPGHEQDSGVITAVAGPDMLVLRGTRLPSAEDYRHRDEFEVSEGEEYTFSTTWCPSYKDIPPPLDVDARIDETLRASTAWAGRCGYTGPYREQVLRSLLTLRLMTDSRTGGIVAAPTTSLPEALGGERNWDYRFCWLRDASLTLEALLSSGYVEETRLWRNWLLRAVAGDPEDLQIMYRIDGSRDLPERHLRGLPGYAGSQPVRIGNGAARQRQTDVLGEVMIALDKARSLGLEGDAQSWALQCALIDELATHWDVPDNGLWEVRGPRRHFTHSRVMVWAAFDRAIAGVEQHGLRGPVDDGASCGRRCGTRSSTRGSTRRGTPSPSTTTRTRSTPPCCSSPSWGSWSRTTRGSSEPSPPSRRTCCGTGCCCATAPRRAWTASPATSTPSWRVPGGWSARTPWRAWWTRRVS